jgi:hypothetical protein
MTWDPPRLLTNQDLINAVAYGRCDQCDKPATYCVYDGRVVR